MHRCEDHFQRRGFTLIEIMVVVAIIAILSLIALTVLSNARKEGRDIVRINDAKQLALSVRLVKEAQGSYPDAYSGGIEIGYGDFTELEGFIPNLKTDPLDRNDANNSEYGYWYYSDLLCNGVLSDVIIVQQLENEGKSNFAAECGGTPPPPMSSNSFIVFVH